MRKRALKFIVSLWLLGGIVFLPFGFIHAATPAGEWTWCGESKTAVPSHPLSWQNLSIGIEQINTQEDYESAYLSIVNAFVELHGEDNEHSRLLSEAVAEYLKVWRVTDGERPMEWNSVTRRNERGERVQRQNLGPSRHIDVACDADWSDYSSSEIGLLYAAAAINHLASRGLDVAQQITAKRIEEVYKSHRSWLLDGLAMWPWEMKLNEFQLDEKFESEAPDWQWIFLRPGVAAAIHFDGFERSTLNAAFTFEPIGFVRYPDESSYTRWWGLSPFVSVTDDSGAGYGVLARYNEFVAGLAYHERHNDVMLYLSIDLVRFVQGKTRWTGVEENLMARKKERLTSR